MSALGQVPREDILSVWANILSNFLHLRSHGSVNISHLHTNQCMKIDQCVKNVPERMHLVQQGFFACLSGAERQCWPRMLLVIHKDLVTQVQYLHLNKRTSLYNHRPPYKHSDTDLCKVPVLPVVTVDFFCVFSIRMT